jgi:GNAT superfamily N-acetyltransferase
VDYEYRRQGIGNQLLDYVKQVGQLAGCVLSRHGTEQCILETILVLSRFHEHFDILVGAMRPGAPVPESMLGLSSLHTLIALLLRTKGRQTAGHASGS